MRERSEIGALLRLLAVSEAGSFAEAARQLGVSRQAVHRSVEALEKAAGGALLDRGSGRLRPTSLGRKLLVHATELRRLERSFQASLRHGGADPSGSLRVTAPPLLADALLAVTVARFSEKWPAVRLSLRVDSSRTDLVRDDYDLMIRVGAKPPEEHYAVNLGNAHVFLCASPSYITQTGAPDSPEDLSNRPMIQFGPREIPRWVLMREEEQRSLAFSPTLVSDSAAVVVGACQAGLGILFAPQLAVAAPLASGQLVRVLPEWSLPSVHVWAIYGHRTLDDPTLREFIRELRAANQILAPS